MNYQSLSLVELKKEFMKTTVRIYGKDYLLGWLKSAYLTPCDECAERDILTKEMIQMQTLIDQSEDVDRCVQDLQNHLQSAEIFGTEQ